MLTISEKGRQKAANSILLTGAARSGTTIVGKIIHSFSDVEYSFEPPGLVTLFSLIDQIPEEQWKLLYETYLYEDHAIKAVTGRGINCNRKDDSSIFCTKGESDIERRLSRSLSRLEAEELATTVVIAYKIPNIVPYVPKLTAYFPATRVVTVTRGYIETLNSLHRKAWFERSNTDKNLLWPFTMHKGVQVPFWVKSEDFEAWVCDMSALDRCAYYYLEMVRAIGKIKRRVDIAYERLVADPVPIAQSLAESLGLSLGEKTMTILSEVKNTDSERNPDILDGVCPSLRTEILSLEKQTAQCYA